MMNSLEVHNCFEGMCSFQLVWSGIRTVFIFISHQQHDPYCVERTVSTNREIPVQGICNGFIFPACELEHLTMAQYYRTDILLSISIRTFLTGTRTQTLTLPSPALPQHTPSSTTSLSNTYIPLGWFTPLIMCAYTCSQNSQSFWSHTSLSHPTLHSFIQSIIPCY